MRVLCTAVPSAGHVNPLLPLLRSLSTAGHEVMLASGPAAAAAAKRAGLSFLEAGLDEAEMVARAAERLSGIAPSERGIAMFATIAAPALLADLLPHLDRLAPDVIVSEEGEWGGPVLAAVAGVPGVAHGWGAPMWTGDELGAIEAGTAALWSAHDVKPQSPAGLFDHLYLDVCPPPLQTSRATDRRRTLRFEPFDSGAAPPPWLEATAARPLVYATLGTVPLFNREPALFETLIRGLDGLAVELVITVGENNDPAGLGQLPANVHVERHLSQVEVLSRSSVAITHGGAGSTLAALAHGVPLLALPRGAPSQQRLADRCAASGAAITLQMDEVTPATVRLAVERLLDDPGYRASATRIGESIQSQPPARSLVPVLEALATVVAHGSG